MGVFFKRATPEKESAIDGILTTVGTDWVRYARFCWLVNAESADKIHVYLREQVGKDDFFLILPIDMAAYRQGLLPGWVWEWLAIDRSKANWPAEVGRVTAHLRPAPPPSLESLSEYLALLDSKDQ